MKKIVLCIIALNFALVSLYSQTILAEPEAIDTTIESSARSRATAGTMLSESDKITADKIHEIDQTYFSGGYINNEDVITGFWAMPLKNGMIAGFAGEYNMATNRNDSYKDENATTNPSEAGTIDFSKVVTEESSFNMRGAFGFGHFGATYEIARNEAPKTVTESKTVAFDGSIVEEKTITQFGDATDPDAVIKPEWNHAIGFAYRMPESMTIFGSVELNVYDGLKETSNIINRSRKADLDKDPDTALEDIDYDTDITKEDNGERRIELALRPAVSIPMNWWKMTKVDTGLNFAIDVFTPGNSITTTEVRSGQNIIGNAISKIETVSLEKDGRFSIGAYGKPTFEWNLLQDKITVIAEPQLSVHYSRIKTDTDSMETTTTETTADGQSTVVVSPKTGTVSVENRFTTVFASNVGFEARPKDWFTFRTGLAYSFTWDTLTTNYDESLNGGTGYSEHSYAFVSKLTPQIGFAFDIEDTFVIDVVLNSTASHDFALLEDYDIQLSCRF